MPFLTPDTPLNAGVKTLTLTIPDNAQFQELITGVLSELINDYSYQKFGTLTPAAAAQLFLEILTNEYRELNMTGAIMPFLTLTLPRGFLPCNGATHARAAYPRLYAALPPAFIVDSDNFITPDLTGAYITGAAAAGGFVGSNQHVLSIDELPPHTHAAAPHAHTSDYPSVGIDIEGAGIPDFTGLGNPPLKIGTTSQEVISIANTGGGAAFDKRPYSLKVIYGIYGY